MKLPPTFQFSQQSLQAFVDCPRRFWLRYVQRVAWPAAVAEPGLRYERHMEQGAAFHRLVQQHALGIPETRLERMVADDEDLRRWWYNYLNHPPADLPAERYPEITLSAPVSDHRLVAKYDLLAIAPGLDGRAVIVDWKTGRKRKRAWYATRLQTRVYRYVLAEGAGAHLSEGLPLAPEQVTMTYWFADYPHEPEHFPYSAAEFGADCEHLTGLIAEIKTMKEDNFILTDNKRHCEYCPYRSLCDRGVAAGPVDKIEGEAEPEEGANLDFDFDQVQEIEF